jgi:hypothetical protein
MKSFHFWKFDNSTLVLPEVPTISVGLNLVCGQLPAQVALADENEFKMTQISAILRDRSGDCSCRS